MNETTQVEIKCPNCRLIKKAGYNNKEKRPVIYGTCIFCETLFVWTKTKTVEIIHASKKSYITKKQL